MDKDTVGINNYNHSISLLERKTLVITGVKKIDNFDNLHLFYVRVTSRHSSA